MTLPDTETQRLIPADVVEEEGGPVKPFLDHLEDLRWVLIKSISALVLGMILCLSAAPQLFAILERPLERAGIILQEAQAEKTQATDAATVQTNTPAATTTTNAPVASVAPEEPLPEFRGVQPFDVTGGFMIIIKIGFWGGLLLSFPFIFYFIADFIVPALRRTERKYIGIACFSGSILFALGVALAYFFISGISLSAFMRLNAWMGMETTVWRAESYIGFIVKLMLGMGLAFELPIAILTLVKLEVLSAEFLAKGRKYMVLANFALSAMVTPQDPISTVMMALPLQILFEVCIIIARYWDREEKRRLQALGLD